MICSSTVSIHENIIASSVSSPPQSPRETSALPRFLHVYTKYPDIYFCPAMSSNTNGGPNKNMQEFLSRYLCQETDDFSYSPPTIPPRQPPGSGVGLRAAALPLVHLLPAIEAFLRVDLLRGLLMQRVRVCCWMCFGLWCRQCFLSREHPWRT